MIWVGKIVNGLSTAFQQLADTDSMVVSVPFLEPSRIPVQGQKTVLL
jgi:hypothetical protein